VVKQRVCTTYLECQKIIRGIGHGTAQPQDALPIRCGGTRHRESLLIPLDHYVNGSTWGFG
jgi:hypothetical protein